MKTIEDCHNLAKKRNGKFLSKEYISAKTKYLWQCQYGHIWKTTYHCIKQGYWCPECGGCKKLTIKDCYNLAFSRNGKFLSKEYVGSTIKYLWQCDQGHRWKATYSQIKRGCWCPMCIGKTIVTIEVCQKIAESRSGKFLSKEYINGRTKHLWQCDQGHQWSTTYRTVSQGKWCPICRSKGKKQKSLFKILKKIFPDLEIFFNYRKFEWLISDTKTKMELDFYFPEIKLAIEYDGGQHFSLVEYFGGSKTLKRIKKNDFLKNKLIHINKNDVGTFIRIPCWEKISEKNILKILERNGVTYA